MKQNRLKVLAIFLGLCIASALPFLVSALDPTELTVHGPIAIYDDAMFHSLATSEGWDGSGTEEFPYIIEDLWITEESDTNPIHIENTRVYFIIRDCLLEGDSFGISVDGIYLLNVQNGSIENNEVVGCLTGISLENSHWNKISGNELYGNEGGISAWDSKHNELVDNIIYSNGSGIVLWTESDYNEILGNQLSTNRDEGIALWWSDHNNVANNRVTGSNHGIILYMDNHHNDISWNEIYENVLYGITLELEHNTDNSITYNAIYENGLGIGLRGESNENLIAYNTITDIEEMGISLEDSSENEILENSIAQCALGIKLDYSSNNAILQNEISTTRFEGLSPVMSSGSQSIVFNENYVTGTWIIGVYPSDGSDAWTIEFNTFGKTSAGDVIGISSRWGAITIDMSDECTIKNNDFYDVQGRFGAIWLLGNDSMIVNNDYTQSNLPGWGETVFDSPGCVVIWYDMFGWYDYAESQGNFVVEGNSPAGTSFPLGTSLCQQVMDLVREMVGGSPNTIPGYPVCHRNRNWDEIVEDISSKLEDHRSPREQILGVQIDG
ncbi:MAG: nitrous oxide reductase family maturation protein NosD [Candidatus Hermodarchaeota archaeon]